MPLLLLVTMAAKAQRSSAAETVKTKKEEVKVNPKKTKGTIWHCQLLRRQI